jgi:SAM-dependent methyltransferase
MMNSSYNPTYFEHLAAIENRHFWFRARRKVISSIVKKAKSDMDPGYRVLEVGCGTGNVLHALEDVCSDGIVIGMDLFSEGLRHARRCTTCSLVQGDIQALPFAKKFHLIGLFDVLEHISDDNKVLEDLHSMLVNDGLLLLTVPAHPSLWSYFDEESHHARRYEFAELESKLLKAGYRIEYITYYMSGIFPFLWLIRRSRQGRETKNAKDLAYGELRIVPIVNELLGFIISQEFRLIARKCKIPIGTSILAMARKA